MQAMVRSKDLPELLNGDDVVIPHLALAWRQHNRERDASTFLASTKVRRPELFSDLAADHQCGCFPGRRWLYDHYPVLIMDE